MKYLYRVVYRTRPQYWDVSETEHDHPWQTYSSAGNTSGRPYTNAAPVKSIVTTENSVNTKYEYKGQKFPLTQEWQDL
jgi:hypothetical protein